MKFFIRTLWIQFLLFLALSGQAFARSQIQQYLSYEQRLLLSYLLNSADTSDDEKVRDFDKIVHELIKNLRPAKPPRTVLVNTMEEFLRYYRGTWPNSHSLETDLLIIEEIGSRDPIKIMAGNEELRAQIQEYHKEQIRFIREIMPSYDELTGLVNRIIQKSTASQGQGAYTSRAVKLRIMNSFEAFFDKSIEKIERVGQTISESKLKLSGSNPMLEVFLNVAIGRYFENMSLPSKKQILSAVLGGELTATELGKFATMIANSGPQFQKLLQIIARESGLPQEMQDIFKTLESSGKNVPWVIVSKIIEAEVKRGNFSFTYVNPKPMGVGTMAQVHEARMNVGGKETEVVVRFLKPGIENRVQEDRIILEKIAPDIDSALQKVDPNAPSLAAINEQLYETVRAELDLEDTIKQQKMGRQTYTRNFEEKVGNKKIQINFGVPDVFSARNGESQIIVQERVYGKGLTKVAEENQRSFPQLKKIIAEKLSTMWVQSTFFESGFFHSDLHPGNLLVDAKGDKINVSILDFGMTGVVSEKHKALFLIANIAAELKRPKMIADVLWKMSIEAENKINQQELLSRVEAQLKVQALAPDAWIAWGANQGLKAPLVVINLNRGMMVLDQMLREAGSSMNIKTISSKLVLANKLRTLRLLRGEGVLRWRDLAIGIWKLSRSSTAAPTTTTTSTTTTTGSRAGLRCIDLFAN